MTGLSKQAVINGAKAAEEHGLIQRISKVGRGHVATWEVLIKEKVNDIDLLTNGQQNGPFKGEKVNDIDSKGKQNRHMKESSKEKEEEKEKNILPPTKDETYLPDADTQAALLFPKACRGIEGELADLKMVNWVLGSDDLQNSLAWCLKETGLTKPSKKTEREDWAKDIAEHVNEFGPSELPRLYAATVKKMDKEEWNISRPGSMTKTMRGLYRKLRDKPKPEEADGPIDPPEPKPEYEQTWNRVKRSHKALFDLLKLGRTKAISQENGTITVMCDRPQDARNLTGRYHQLLLPPDVSFEFVTREETR